MLDSLQYKALAKPRTICILGAHLLNKNPDIPLMEYSVEVILAQ